ncbi:MAG: GNAT family N-acetyltransferase [Halobacteriovoraceae bacterium]|jgi:RimJ/RimL family protein N-acetyltransferase|nr:GNAT family N-acetyltransferase [Halobacteriovoraceae bacterium]
MAIKEATFKFNLPIFETDRLRLRPFNESDLNNLRTLETDFEVVKYLGNGQIRESEETLNYLKKHFKDYQKYGLGLYAVEDKITGAFIGRSGLIPWHFNGRLEWEIGYTLMKSSWGKGMATELATFLKNWAKANMSLNYVVSLINAENIKSINVSKKIGMDFWKEVEINGHKCNAYRVFL